MCLKGDDCLYSHDLSTVPCKFFYLYARCQNAAETCRFSHDLAREDALAYFEKEKQEKEDESSKKEQGIDVHLDTGQLAVPEVLPFGVSFVPEKGEHPLKEEEEEEWASSDEYTEGSDSEEDAPSNDTEQTQSERASDSTVVSSDETVLPFGVSLSTMAPSRSSDKDLSFPAYAP